MVKLIFTKLLKSFAISIINFINIDINNHDEKLQGWMTTILVLNDFISIILRQKFSTPYSSLKILYYYLQVPIGFGKTIPAV